jgi:TfoX/Sxy family transcriptional regulator of competence genes
MAAKIKPAPRAAQQSAPSMPKWQAAPPQLVQIFERALQAFPEAVPKKMFGYPAAFVGGQLFAGLHQHSLILRLPADDRATLLERPGRPVFEPMPGRPMREYVVVPPTVIQSPEQLTDWFARALNCTRS